jgi:hypothetical protein
MWDVEKVRDLVADKNHAATFFCGGHFAPLLDALVVQVGTVMAQGDSMPAPTVVEVGSGEGYYIGSIQTRLAGVSRAGWFGTDISKPAVVPDITGVVTGDHYVPGPEGTP